MANVNHSTLTDPYLHEPKGVASAASGEVYIADGAGTGAWTQLQRHVGSYSSFNTLAPYTHATTTSDTALNPSLTVVDSNGFSGVSTPNAGVRYDGLESIHAGITFTSSVRQASGGDRDVELVLYLNGSELTGSRVVTTAVTGAWHQYTTAFNTTLATNDVITVHVRADSTATIEFASAYLRITGANI